MLESFLLNQAALFTLILGRVGGLIATAPVFSGQSAPLRFRALLAVALAGLLLPPLSSTELSLAGETAGGPGAGLDPPRLTMMIGLEVIVGLLIGLGVMILLSGVQVAGQIVAQVSGLSLGDVFNPALDDTVSVFSQLFYFIALAAFVCMGGHRMTLEALLGTFEWSPPGSAAFGATYADALVGLLSQSFELGIRAAAPLLISLFLATVVLGLISRTLPQINTIVVGFSVNSLLTLSVMFLTIGSVVWTFQAPLDDALATLMEATQPAEALAAK
ncbi:MAG: flagellar biosynthetic protein FliR [Planctomycetota bacterium]